MLAVLPVGTDFPGQYHAGYGGGECIAPGSSQESDPQEEAGQEEPGRFQTRAAFHIRKSASGAKVRFPSHAPIIGVRLPFSPITWPSRSATKYRKKIKSAT